MDSRKRFLEENAARLIQAGFGAEARPDTLTRQQTWRRLVAQMHANRTAVAFPDWALVFLTGALVLVAAWLAGQTLGAGVPLTVSQPLVVVALLLTSTLVWVPVAAILIVIRRRYA